MASPSQGLRCVRVSCLACAEDKVHPSHYSCVTSELGYR
jgi:hypothetical protein